MFLIIFSLVIACILLYLNVISTIKKIQDKDDIVLNKILGSLLVIYISTWIFIALFSVSYS
ncbi:MAG: hypothetical protein E6929_07285 [Clostridium sp.]|nr:hypothetical protein [Clostridium sp.]